MTFNPKKDFCDDANRRKWWASVAEQKFFNDAITAATAVQLHGLNHPPDMATAAANAWKLEGAKQFALILLNLSEFGTPPTPPERRDNLKHNA